MRDDDDGLRFLLSGRRLNNADHDRILGRVLRRTSGRRRRGIVWPAGAIMLVALSASALLHLRPRDEVVRPTWLAAKGSTAGPLLNARCSERPPGICRRGDRLIFEVDGAVEGGLFAAYAEHESGARTWFFPAADGHYAAVPSRGGFSLVREVGRIRDDEAPGRYALQLFLLDVPVDRAALTAGTVRSRARATVPMEVVP